MKTILKNCLLDGEVRDITLFGERIERVAPSRTETADGLDMSGKIIIPGMIDLHTHVRDLQQSYKESWLTAGYAAIAGGVTTLFDMPNTLPPTDTLAHLREKQKAAEQCLVNYGIYAGASPHNLRDLEEMLEMNAVPAIKVFLAASSSNEVIESEELLEPIFRLARKYDKPVLTHCELQSCISAREAMFSDASHNNVGFHSVIRNPECALRAVELVLRIAARVKNKLMILHVSTAEEIALIRKYKSVGDFPIYAETTPHHLLLSEEILKTAGNFGKVNPPLRTKRDNNALFYAVLDGTIDTIGSDHAPHTLEEKQRPYNQAPSGFPGLETSLPLLISRYLTEGDLPLSKIVELTSKNPAAIMGLQERGALKAGYYADFVVIDPNTGSTVRAESFESKAHYSPFDGFALRGKITMTCVNGKLYVNET